MCAIAGLLDETWDNTTNSIKTPGGETRCLRNFSLPIDQNVNHVIPVSQFLVE